MQGTPLRHHSTKRLDSSLEWDVGFLWNGYRECYLIPGGAFQFLDDLAPSYFSLSFLTPSHQNGHRKEPRFSGQLPQYSTNYCSLVQNNYTYRQAPSHHHHARRAASHSHSAEPNRDIPRPNSYSLPTRRSLKLTRILLYIILAYRDADLLHHALTSRGAKDPNHRLQPECHFQLGPRFQIRSSVGRAGLPSVNDAEAGSH